MPRRAEIKSAIATARVALDHAIERLEALSDDDRHRFSYSVHALNNYLMLVVTTIQLLRSRAAIRNDRDTSLWLDSLAHSTNLMMSTARGVLTGSADGVPPLLMEQTSLSEIAASACSAYRDIASRKAVDIEWTPPAVTDCVLTDRVAAGAVLDNLMSNAVKYSEPGGIVEVSVTTDPSEVTCAVRDHGRGLTAEDQTKLFQRGVTLSARPTAGESSTGYGLAVANDLATALGGRLSCVSIPGEGCSFRFALTLASAASPEASQHGASRRDH